MPRAAAIGVLIADDQDQFVELLEAILAAEEDLTVVGRAGNGEEAVERAAALEPDVVLMDISMPLLDGLEATRRIRAELPGATVVVVTGSSSDEDRAAAREAGAAAYVTKERIADELVAALRTAARSERLS